METVDLIERYLKENSQSIDMDDSFNLVDGKIFRWDFKNIAKPTDEKLKSYIEAVKTEGDEYKASEEKKKTLKEKLKLFDKSKTYTAAQLRDVLADILEYLK